MKQSNFLIILFALSLIGCVKDKYELEQDSISLSPTIAAPLIKASIEAKDILSAIDSNLLRENGDQLLEFVYSDSVYSLSLSEIIEIKDETVDYSFQLQPLRIDDVDDAITAIRLDTVALRAGNPFLSLYSSVANSCDNAFPAFPEQNIGDIDLSISDAAFTTATFSEGILKLELENKWATELTNVELSLKRVSDGVSIDTLRYASIPPNFSLADSVDLAGKTMEDDMVIEFIKLSSPGTASPVCINDNDSIIAKFSGRNFVIVAGTAIFPNQEVLNDTFSVDIDLGVGEKLETLILKDGDLVLDLDYEIKETAKLYIELPYAVKDGRSFIDSISIGAGPITKNASFDLSGYSFDLTKGGTGFNSIETRVRANVVSSGLPVSFDTANAVTAKVSMTSVVPSFLDGYFGAQDISLDEATQSFDIGSSEIFQKMAFAKPEITLGFHSSFGIPMTISSINLKMKNDEDSETLEPGSKIPFEISGANIANLGEKVTSNLVLDNTTNIADLINLWPNEVVTGIDGSINPDGDTYNFALDTSRLDVTLDLTIPLYGVIEDFGYVDTIEVDSAIARVFENVVSASLRTNVDNGFPLEGKVKFYITDESYMILDSLSSADGNDILISAATVNPSTGNVVSKGGRQADLIADETDVNLLKNVGNKLLIFATLNTANSGNDVKIYSNQSMSLKLGILGKFNFNISTNSEEEE